MEERVILVDENDTEIGSETKLKAHREGMLHRAFSIFVFNSKKQLLLQKRAATKYHSAGLWANTCCSHPRPKESLKKAAHRRLLEEMGFNCELREVFIFKYKKKFVNNLIENEVDHVFLGRFDGKPKPNKEEADDWRWISVERLRKDIRDYPEKYAYWLRLMLDNYPAHLKP